MTIAAIAPEKQIYLELVRWETHVAPVLHPNGIQPGINQQIGEYDIFVGIMWKRFGTPTAEADSGTEEEFNIAFEKWKEDTNRPVLFYFCQQPFPPPRTVDEIKQLEKVILFREKLSKKGLVWDFPEHTCFDDSIRPHLLLALGKMTSRAKSGKEVAKRAAYQNRGSAEDVRQKIYRLGREYEQIRQLMPPSNERTWKMAGIVSQMKPLALSGLTLLPELTNSNLPDDRLAAVTFLEAVPNADYIGWLAGRFESEKPFLFYHSAIALLYAVRNLQHSASEELTAALNKSRAKLKSLLSAGEQSAQESLSIIEEAISEIGQAEKKKSKQS